MIYFRPSHRIQRYFKTNNLATDRGGKPPRRIRRARRHQRTKRLMPSFRVVTLKFISKPIFTSASFI